MQRKVNKLCAVLGGCTDGDRPGFSAVESSAQSAKKPHHHFGTRRMKVSMRRPVGLVTMAT